MKKTLVILILFVAKTTNAQSIYIDPTTTAALFTYSSTLKNEQNKTRKEIIALKKAQAVVGVAMEEVDRIQKKVYKGLKEVSGTVQNGIQIKEIWEEIKFIEKNSETIGKLVSKNPQYSIFAVKAAKQTKEQAIQMGLKVSQIIQSDDTNLMTAGDRYDLLQQIYEDVRMLSVYVYTIKMHLERAKAIGFWKSINPFQGYINTDKNIVENIINQYEILKY